MNLSKSKQQSGFTLVEIAIVLVIIGILLAGVLKGQSLINNGRIKGLVNNMNAVSASYNGYVDRYQAIPGTEKNITFTARGWPTTMTPGTAPLALAPGTTFTDAGDQITFWQSLGAAGFFAYSPIATTNPPSATGGSIGVAITPYTTVPGLSVCLNNVTGLQAEGIDTVVDGPLPASNIGANGGSLQGDTAAAPAGAAPAAIAYSETSAAMWILCRPL